MNNKNIKKLDKLFNRVFQLSELLNDISLELAILIREVSKDEIKKTNRIRKGKSKG